MNWFQRMIGSQLIDCVKEFTGKDCRVDRLLYNNSIGSLHKNLELETERNNLKMVEEVQKIVDIVNQQRTEEVMVIYQTGKYPLAKEHRQFEVLTF